MKYPTLSVIMPNYNYAHYIQEAIDSIVNQSEVPYELLIIDDASTDKSIEIIKSYSEKYSFIHLYEKKVNSGTVKQVNFGITVAQGKYLAFIASDDKWSPNYCEIMLKGILKFPRSAIVTSDPSFFTDESNDAFHTPLIEDRTDQFLSPKKVATLMRENLFWIPGHSSFFQRDKIIECGQYMLELEWHSDYFLSIFIALRYGLTYIPKHLAHLRISHDSYSAKRTYKKQKMVLKTVFHLINEQKYSDIRKLFFYADPILNLDYAKRYIVRHPFKWRQLPFLFLLRALKHLRKKRLYLKHQPNES